MNIEVRGYLSWNLLYTARHLAAMAAEREGLPNLPSPIDQRERAYVLSTVVTAVTFLDAAVNEVYQDAADGPETSYSRRMPQQTRERLASMWRLTNSGRSFSTLERYEMGLVIVGAKPLDHDVNPYQDALACIRLRNWIAHYRPQQLGRHLEQPKLSEILRAKFPVTHR